MLVVAVDAQDRGPVSSVADVSCSFVFGGKRVLGVSACRMGWGCGDDEEGWEESEEI